MQKFKDELELLNNVPTGDVERGALSRVVYDNNAAAEAAGVVGVEGCPAGRGPEVLVIDQNVINTSWNAQEAGRREVVCRALKARGEAGGVVVYLCTIHEKLGYAPESSLHCAAGYPGDGPIASPIDRFVRERLEGERNPVYQRFLPLPQELQAKG